LVENKENPSSMTTARMSAFRRFLPGRRTAVAVLAGAGIVLSPLPAMAAAPAGTAAAAPAVAAPAALAAPAVAAPNGRAQAAVNTALAQVGDPYVWAAAGPDAFDCSGLTQFAYRAAGISLPHSSQAQSTMGTPVSKAALQPGDLVFFFSPVSHVGMYVGGGKMVHAPTAGQTVQVMNVDWMPGFAGARRLA
jgi:cell wall-associated NlpC family hydrolase